MESALGDEEIARALQAMDNGLRKRKRSVSVSEEVRKPRSRKPDTTTPARRRSAVANPPSPLSSSGSVGSPDAAEHPDESMEVPKNDANLPSELLDIESCLACGKLFSSSASEPKAILPSKESHLICESCFVQYSLPPFKAQPAVKASPSHRCEGHGCAITFVTADRLRDHLHRIHGAPAKVS